MATTQAQAQQKPDEPRGGKTSGKRETRETRLDDDVSMPGYVAPGDAPFDTLDPTEHATSVIPDKASAARAGFGVVNAVIPVEQIPGAVVGPREDRDESKDRTETYEAIGPDGKPVTVTHNLETGETSI